MGPYQLHFYLLSSFTRGNRYIKLTVPYNDKSGTEKQVASTLRAANTICGPVSFIAMNVWGFICPVDSESFKVVTLGMVIDASMYINRKMMVLIHCI